MVCVCTCDVHHVCFSNDDPILSLGISSMTQKIPLWMLIIIYLAQTLLSTCSQ